MKQRFLISFGLISILLVAQAVLLQQDLVSKNVILLLGLGSLLFVAATAWFTVHHIFQPLQKISGFIRSISSGDYTARLDEEIPYEMGRLARELSSTLQKMLEQSSLSKSFLENILTPMFLTEPDGRLKWMNENTLKLLEYEGKPEDYYGMKLGKFFYHDENRETITEKALEEMTRQFVKSEVKTDKGNTRYISICCSPIKNYNDELIGGFSTVMDFTNIKLKEEQLVANTKRMTQMADRSATISQQLASATEQLSALIEQAARGAEHQGGMTVEVATAMEQMTATVMEVARNSSMASNSAEQTGKVASDGRRAVDEVIQLILSVSERTTALNQSMANLGEKADGIGRIIEVINDIADQTNLLALNAAIEAARAGDAGRGFAVVADEVRKLAEKTTQATKDVASNIQSIQESARQSAQEMLLAQQAVEQSTEKSTFAGEQLHSIEEMVGFSVGQVQEIAAATEEQSATSEQITRSTDSIRGISEEMAAATRQSEEAVRELAKLANDLNALIDEMRAG